MVSVIMVRCVMSRYIDADALIARAFQDSERMYLESVVKHTPSIDIVRRKPVVGYEGYYEVDMYGKFCGFGIYASATMRCIYLCSILPLRVNVTVL